MSHDINRIFVFFRQNNCLISWLLVRCADVFIRFK